MWQTALPAVPPSCSSGSEGKSGCTPTHGGQGCPRLSLFCGLQEACPAALRPKEAGQHLRPGGHSCYTLDFLFCFGRMQVLCT